MFGAITITQVGGPKFPARVVNRFKKDTMAKVAFSWHGQFRPIHFTTEGARKYNYGKRVTKNVRTGKVYRTRTGARRAPSGLPLVWSGRSRVLAMRARVRATARGSRCSMPVRAFNFVPPGNRRLRMGQEFTRVLPAETGKLRTTAGKYIRQRFGGYDRRVTVTYR